MDHRSNPFPFHRPGDAGDACLRGVPCSPLTHHSRVSERDGSQLFRGAVSEPDRQRGVGMEFVVLLCGRISKRFSFIRQLGANEGDLRPSRTDSPFQMIWVEYDMCIGL